MTVCVQTASNCGYTNNLVRLLNCAMNTDDYTITTDKHRFDIESIHAYLTRSYWSPGIPLSVVRKAIDHSLCFGLLYRTEQIGFSRVITDRATFAYLADVYVLEAHRGKGLAKRMMDAVHGHPDLQGLRRCMLATRDAHSLYEQYGYTALANPRTIMEILRLDIYARGVTRNSDLR